MAKRKNSHKYIAIEGLDGSGKSRLAQNLGRLLASQGHTYVLTREPGGTPISEQAREVLKHGDLNGLNPHSEYGWFCVSRGAYFGKGLDGSPSRFIQDLSEGHVISDRCFWSSVAYQGFGRGMNVEDIIKTSKLFTDNRFPDVVIRIRRDIVDCMRTATKRIGSDAPDKYNRESQLFYGRVDDGYTYLCDRFKDSAFVLDYVDGEEEMALRAYNLIKGKL